MASAARISSSRVFMPDTLSGSRLELYADQRILDMGRTDPQKQRPKLSASGADDDGKRRAAPRHVHHEISALQQADFIGQRHVHILIGPRLVDSPAARSTAERFPEMCEPGVEVARESTR